MIEVTVNWIAIVVSAVISMGLGMLWYGPLFGKQWMALVGLKQTDAGKGNMAIAMSLAFASYFLLAWVLKHTIAFSTAAGWSTPDALGGAMAAFWIWLGYFATTGLGVVLWEMKPVKLYFINQGYYLVNLLLVGAVLGGLV